MSAKNVMKNTTNKRENYWYTLIILSDKNHKEKLKLLSKQLKISRTKIIGKLIESFINKHE